ncbi:hypothetical protein BC830DRAFT_718887 [Chytriomyces sp. MP71]|nr:hypothetical protein BC830DRAFT_718887 [Chytriomyces sp. MP71]
MPTLMANGMQLIICLHDRYELDDDAYYDKYIKRGGLQAFYNHPQAQAVFDWRLAYIVSHVNPSMGNRTWYQIPEAIYAFEIQNEAQADSSVTSLMPAQRNPRWWCDRATSLRGVIGFNSPILISTGGGKGFSDSIVDENFECPAIDVIALHSYDSDITVYRPAIDLAVKKAKLNEKIVILEEFGAVGKAETKADWISRVSTIAREAGINWLPWEVSKPGGGSDFDFYVNDTAAWHALSNAASTLPADETELKKRDDGNPWAGVSSFFLYAYSIDDQAEILGNLQSAGVTKIRIFLTSIGAGSKNSNCNEVNDLESNDVGDYDDTILTMIDQLLQTMASGNYGIKLLICMHDRYQLDDSWGCDGYCTKFIQSMDVRSLDGFYKNSDAIAAYDARLQHIVNFTSSFIDDSGQNKTFGQLSDLIYAFEIQNEGQADGNGDQTPNGLHYSVDDGDRNWWCDRATTLKISEVWHTDSGIKISTGGGKDFYSSDLSENFNCGALDIVALHSYDDASQFGDTLSSIKQKADSNSKEIIFEEFGATGSPDSKAGLINQGSSAAQNAGISWLSWQVSKPGGNEGDYDYYINDESAWSALTSAASGSPQRRDAPTVSMIARDNAFSPPAWAGVNSYFLYSYPANEQISMFQTLQQANITVVRVFITSISAGTKGADNIQVHDLEESGVGTWNDKILMLVDDMMKRAEPFGIKFIICMHDRYMLDQTWGGCDGYCSLYVQPAGSLDGFYKNATAIQSFDARLQHIVSHTSSNFAGKAWAQLSNVKTVFIAVHSF